MKSSYQYQKSLITGLFLKLLRKMFPDKITLPGIIFIFFFCLSQVAFAYSVNEVEWNDGVTGVLSQGGTISIGDYTVKAISFTAPVIEIDRNNPLSPFVWIELYRNDSLIVSQPMMKGDYFNSSDSEVRLEILDLPSPDSASWVVNSYSPWVSFKLRQRGTPDLSLEVSAGKGVYVYSQDEFLTVNISLKNTGSARAKNIDLNIDTGGLSIRRGIDNEHFDGLEKNEEIVRTIDLSVPSVSMSKMYDISAKASGYDIKDLRFTGEGSASLEISPPYVDYQLKKIITKKESMFIGDKLIVDLSFQNTGPYALSSVRISDSVPENFELITNTSLDWNISAIKPDGMWSATYVLTPLEAGTFSLPAARMRYSVNGQDFESISNMDFISVYGPKIKITKDVTPGTLIKGQEAVVTIRIRNEGNIPAQVKVEDALPAGVNLTEGNLSIPSTFLEEGGEVTSKYAFKSNINGSIRLPPAVAYFGFGDRKGKTVSEILSIENGTAPEKTENTMDKQQEPVLTPAGTAKSYPEREATATPANEKKSPGFGFILSILVIIFIILIKK